MAKVKRKKGRDYKRERELAIKRGETGNGSSSGDATRHRARRKVEKRLGHKLPPTRVVDHKKRLRDGGSNDDSNLRVLSLSANAADGGRVGDASKKGKRVKVKK